MPKDAWAVFHRGLTRHVIPMGDTGEHDDESTCKCLPKVVILEDGMCIIHNAWDNREVIEKIEAILNQSHTNKS